MKKVIYSRYSDNRDDRFSIITTIYKDEKNKFWVEKKPRTEKAAEHIKSLICKFDLLEKHKRSSEVKINKCYIKENSVIFEYVEGEQLSTVLTKLIVDEKYQEFIEKIKEYIELIKIFSNIIPFKVTKEFIDIFGNVTFFKPLDALRVVNIDLAFDNIIINNCINIIDYEWIFEFPVPFNFVVYRAVNSYITKQSLENKISLEEVCKVLAITENELIQYKEMEANFQNYIKGNKVRFERDIKTNITLEDILCYKRQQHNNIIVQVFLDEGEGFFEEKSYKTELLEIESNVYKLSLSVPNNVKSIRVDPIEDFCLMQIKSALANKNNKLVISSYTTNSLLINDIRLFTHQDPQIIFGDLLNQDINAIEVIFKMIKLDMEVTGLMQNILADNIEIKDRVLKLQEEQQLLNTILTNKDNRCNELLNENSYLKDDDAKLLNENSYLKDDNIKLINENNQLKKAVQNVNDELSAIKNSKRWKIIQMLLLERKRE